MMGDCTEQCSNIQEHTQEPPEDVNLAAESSILPILGSVGSSTGGRASIRSLRYPVLKELHAIAPLRFGLAPGIPDCALRLSHKFAQKFVSFTDANPFTLPGFCDVKGKQALHRKQHVQHVSS